VELDFIERPSPNFDERHLPVSMIVLHYTGMPDAEGALDRLTSPEAKVSCHYLIDEDGTTYIPRTALRDAFFATSDYEGITGTLTCDENGDCADAKISVSEVQDVDGTLTFVRIWP